MRLSRRAQRYAPPTSRRPRATSHPSISSPTRRVDVRASSSHRRAFELDDAQARSGSWRYAARRLPRTDSSAPSPVFPARTRPRLPSRKSSVVRRIPRRRRPLARARARGGELRDRRRKHRGRERRDRRRKHRGRSVVSSPRPRTRRGASFGERRCRAKRRRRREGETSDARRSSRRG